MNENEADKMISPRSSNYERLEGGMGPSRMGMRNFQWKKLAIGVIVIVGLVWVFTPSEKGPDLSGVDYDPLPPVPEADVDPQVEPAPERPVEHPTVEHSTPDSPTRPAPSGPRPTSFDSDQDPSKTVYCKTPYKEGTPLVQWALMIDAGSTGSRIHVYKFNNCGPSPAYEYEVFRQRRPGLSAFAGQPQDAAASLDALLDVAVQTVPEALRACTPVAVKATAGLRLLGAAQSGEILAAVRERLRTVYPFPLAPQDPVTIMDGKDEGVYAWITANYLKDTIRADSPKGAPLYAVLDLGGASTQIVFEPKFDSTKPDSTLEEGEHKYDLTFGGHTHVLYQHSYLGYGLMRARLSVHKLVRFMASLRRNAGTEIGNPCLAKGTTREVEIDDEQTKKLVKVTMVGEDIGSYEACNRVMELVMAKDSICEMKPCSFDGVYQPSLLDTFPDGKVLLLSYFYDRIAPLLPATNPPPLTVSTIAELAHDVCEGAASWAKRWHGNRAALDELENRPEHCLDLTFMHALLRLGYEFADDREVQIGKQIDGTELGWTLGATIAMVGGELTCRV
ncbi:hypothetical protein DENSPDRAFT_773329 [Dentipellis sp. KUC8613]|nr:hypothetical protein DENSPDRAFT_773329 [Dentipellis sp. KUC8613]